MKRDVLRISSAPLHLSLPLYQLRARVWAAADDEFEVWQLPAPATPHIKSAVRIAGLRGRNLELIQHRVLKQLVHGGVKLRPRRAAEQILGEAQEYPISEHLALTLGLLFRALAPMRSRENMLRVVEGIEAMSREEAAYWLGMAMHRVNPRRVLKALRMLLTDPARRIEGVR